MNKNVLWGLLALVFVAPNLSAGIFNPDISTIVPDDRRIDWSQTGVPGGIPNYTRVCGTIDASTYGNGSTDSSVAISSAIQSSNGSSADPCVVQLSAGDFLISSPIGFNQKSYVVLRGAGADKTILHSIGAGINIGGGGDRLLTMTVTGATKGVMSVNVSDTTHLVSNGLIAIRRTNPSFVYSDAGNSNFISQMALITSVSGNTIHFTPALFYDFSVGTQIVDFYGEFGFTTLFSGIEDLKIDQSQAGSSSAFSMVQCYACWAKGIHFYKAYGYNTLLLNNVNCEIRDSIFDDSQNFGADTGGLVVTSWTQTGNGGNTGLKVENNIFNKIGIILEKAASGNYLGYNFGYGFVTNPGFDCDGGMFNTNHAAQNMMNLWEGNTVEMFQDDGYHGSGSHGLLFRNNFTAFSVLYNCNLKAVSLNRWAYYYAALGNILGSSSYVPTFYSVTEDTYSGSTIFQLGYPNMGNTCYSVSTCGTKPGNNWSPDPTNQPYTGTYPDPMVSSTLIRAGNYDYFHKCPWDDSNNQCLDSAGVSNLALPSSLYYMNQPAWWPSAKPWPPVGPDVLGLANKIPAQDCFEKTFFINGGKFNRAQCYGNVVASTPSAPSITSNPQNISVTVGQTATFNVVADGNPSPTYQWMKGGAPVSGATSASYVTPALTLNDDGSKFYCAVSNSYGTVTSSTATLTVITGPVITSDGFLPFKNVFNPSRGEKISVQFGLTQDSAVKLEVYTRRGEKVRTLVEGSLSSGSQSQNWDGRNESGSTVASGVYVLYLTINGQHQTNKVVVK